MPLGHLGHADGQRDRHGSGQPFGNGADREGYGGHEHVEPRLAAEHSDSNGQGGHRQDDIEQQLAEGGHALGQGRVQHLGRRNQLVDAAYFRLIADGHHHAGTRPVGDQGR